MFVSETGMRVSQVCVQPVLAGEGLVAQSTHEGFVSGVDATVATPFGLVPEEFTTKRAAVHRPPPSSTLRPSATLQRDT